MDKWCTRPSRWELCKIWCCGCTISIGGVQWWITFHLWNCLTVSVLSENFLSMFSKLGSSNWFRSTFVCRERDQQNQPHNNSHSKEYFWLIHLIHPHLLVLLWHQIKYFKLFYCWCALSMDFSRFLSGVQLKLELVVLWAGRHKEKTPHLTSPERIDGLNQNSETHHTLVWLVRVGAVQLTVTNGALALSPGIAWNEAKCIVGTFSNWKYILLLRSFRCNTWEPHFQCPVGRNVPFYVGTWVAR